GRDIFGGLEYAERARALGMRLALGDLLAVEVGHLLEEMHIMEQKGAIGTDRERLTVARSRRAGAGCGGGRTRFIRCSHGSSPAISMPARHRSPRAAPRIESTPFARQTGRSGIAPPLVRGSAGPSARSRCDPRSGHRTCR